MNMLGMKECHGQRSIPAAVARLATYRFMRFRELPKLDGSSRIEAIQVMPRHVWRSHSGVGEGLEVVRHGVRIPRRCSSAWMASAAVLLTPDDHLDELFSKLGAQQDGWFIPQRSRLGTRPVAEGR